MFTVEDGSGEVVGANSYTTVAYFKAYWDDRGFDYTVYSPDSKIERALVQATDFIELKYRTRFKGSKLVYDPEQPLSFPRACLYVNCRLVEGVPTLLQNATCEYAKRALTSTTGLNPDPAGYDATGQIITSSHVKVGPIEKDQTYEAGTATILRAYPTADRMLSEYIVCADGVERA